MKNKETRVIVFDLGNVLIPFDYSIIIKKLNLIREGLGDHFVKKYNDNYHLHRSFEKWELSTDNFISIMLGWLDHLISSEEFCSLYSDIFTLNEETISLLPKLKLNYKLVLLSNTNYIHQKYGWEKYGFFYNFDKLILSHEVGAVKPEAKIYKAVEEFSNELPGAHLFIDDIQDYVNGAKRMGWDAVQFTGYADLVNEFKSRNIIF
ncbi:MAG: HAD-IA family hydrolase [Melioribacteraceae bacterium]|nr:HAD-IA family hydrolase [Melioribacteraceae bacterium]